MASALRFGTSPFAKCLPKSPAENSQTIAHTTDSGRLALD
jgi:hypothetical protein